MWIKEGVTYWVKRLKTKDGYWSYGVKNPAYRYFISTKMIKEAVEEVFKDWPTKRKLYESYSNEDN